MAVSEAPPLAEAELLSGRDERWRTFLLSHPDSLPYHHPAWVDALTEAYGYDPFAVVLRSPDGEIQAGIPVLEVGGRIRGRRWVSLPFTDYCPPLTGAGISSQALAEAAESLRAEHRAESLEIRSGVGGFEAEERGVRHELALGDPDALFAAFKPQVRRNIRKAEGAGLTVRRADERDDLVRTYYRLHADTRRRLGVPPQPRRFFDCLWSHVVGSNLGHLLLAYSGDVPVAGAFFIQWNGRLVYKYGASDQKHWALRPNNLLFWDCIRRSAEAGATSLDFGRTDLADEGLRRFKASWGAVETPLEYTALGRAPRRAGGSSGERLRPLFRASPGWVGRAVGTAFYRLTA